MHSASASSKFAVNGGRDIATGTGSREEARGGRTGGEGVERREESTVDGVTKGAGVGKERQMPHWTVKIVYIWIHGLHCVLTYFK